jgi:hypothetical protein
MQTSVSVGIYDLLLSGPIDPVADICHRLKQHPLAPHRHHDLLRGDSSSPDSLLDSSTFSPFGIEHEVLRHHPEVDSVSDPLRGFFQLAAAEAESRSRLYGTAAVIINSNIKGNSKPTSSFSDCHQFGNDPQHRIIAMTSVRPVERTVADVPRSPIARDCSIRINQHGEKVFVCQHPNCAREFKTSSHLRRHGFVHNGERPHPCPYCERRFARHGDLKVHTRTHTGERPYECNTCGRTFVQASAFARHRRLHTSSTASPASRAHAVPRGCDSPVALLSIPSANEDDNLLHAHKVLSERISNNHHLRLKLISSESIVPNSPTSSSPLSLSLGANSPLHPASTASVGSAGEVDCGWDDEEDLIEAH